MTLYDQAVQRGRERYGDRFVPPAGEGLLIRTAMRDLVNAYNSNARVEVDIWGDGETILRGRVSMTTGWAPSFLLMRRRSDIGSMWLLDSRSKILRVVAP